MRKIILAVFILTVCGVIFYLYFSGGQAIAKERPDSKRHCFDFTNNLPEDLIDRIDNYYAKILQDNFDVDFVFAVVPNLAGKTIIDYAAELFTAWKIGKSTQGKKGLLILVAKKEQQAKIEVGYDLEHIYPDLYVGQVEREVLKEFLELGNWEHGFMSTIENFTGRVEMSAQKGELIKDLAGSQAGHLSGGAGAKTAFDFGKALQKPVPKIGEGRRRYFSAQASPIEAWQRYMEYCANLIPDKTVDIFSDATKEFYRHWPSTSGQMRAEAENMSNVPMQAAIEGRHAVVLPVYADNPKRLIEKCPYFFIKDNAGWKIDLAVMARSLMMINSTGGWRFMATDHPYMFAFKDLVIETNQIYVYSGQGAFLGINYRAWARGYEWDKEFQGYKVWPEYRGPAHDAGMEYPRAREEVNPDTLISIDGVHITKIDQDWDELMFKYKPGDVVKVEVARAGKKMIIPVTLRKPRVFRDEWLYGRKSGDPWLGIYYAGSMPYERKAAGDWVSYLVEVVPGSPAEKAGLKVGDLVYAIWDSVDKPLKSENFKPGDKVELKIMRDLKAKMTITITAGEWGPGKEGL